MRIPKQLLFFAFLPVHVSHKTACYSNDIDIQGGFSYTPDTPQREFVRKRFSLELVICGAPLIDIKHLYKSYDRKPVLADVNLSVRRGSVMGLLGPNGAGKTTLIAILTGIISKDSGSITVDGMDLDRELRSIQSKCSYIPQSFAFYPRLTARENLEYFGALWGMKGKKLQERMEFCIDIGSMQNFVNKRVDKFSGGMKRRLNLAIGLLNDPEILYLDEPTVGVDTQSRGYILETIKKINRDRQTTIIYTSHYMDEIEQVSDDIAVINEGKIILHDDTKAILTRAGDACGHRTLEGLFLKLTDIRLRDED